MKEQEKFDDIIRSKFEAQEFSFSEENWEKAETALDSGRKWKKALWFSLMFLGGLVAGIAIMLPFIKDEKQGESKIIAQVVEKQKEEIPVSANEIKEEKTVSEKQTMPEEIKTAPVRHEDGRTQSLGGVEKIPATHSAGISEETKLSKNKPEVQKYIPPAPQNENNAPEVLITKKESGEKQNEKPEEKTNAATEIQFQNNPGSSILIGMNSNSKRDSLNDAKIKALQNKIDSLSEVITLAFARPTEQPFVQAKDSVKTKKDSSTAVQQAIVPAPAIPTPAKSLSSITVFSLDAGTNYLLGWNYGDAAEGRGFNPVLGFGVTHFFNMHWSVQTGIQYGSVAHLKVSTKTFSTSSPDFGLNTVDSIVDTKWIHYAVVPVFVQYHFNNKNSIGIGGSISYLVNTTSNFIVNSYADYRDPVSTEKKSFGYTSGFDQWNATLAVSYSRRISDKFNVSAEAHYGLMDIKDNTFFSREKFERNSGVKILISYDLF